MSAAEVQETSETPEDIIAKSASRLRDLRKRAENLYQERVYKLMQEHGCDLVQAHAHASRDPTASQALEMSLEIAEDVIARSGARAALSGSAPDG
ncbi:hypothetical protein [Albimonas pacifica]|uniref:ANTAR domain-containing protein n=1 Tax=Albimonas pacifica TaxID=1114924 RepID=A0A1I3QJY9_9RHOB|nr:hypothetical protein [Albimonas pacifica]SFJ33506.1 hypothetical protein SAMN05216258_1424 [Albimonas pacifica]